MCDWSAVELLGSWRDRVQPELERLGALDFRADEDGSKATLELKGGAVVASITAWSTGMLELISSEPDVITEQRDSRALADAVLDGWLTRLRQGERERRDG
jgi:hypothetical protein